jgi:predicted tellurium resistance membrane protein TerC
MLELLADPNAWLAFATLAALEIVLGIDNLICGLPLTAAASGQRSA